MAIQGPFNLGSGGTRRWTADTTGRVSLDEVSLDTVGTHIVQIAKGGATIVMTPEARLKDADVVSVGWIEVAYQDLNSGNDVAAGTDITADGLYAIRCDVGCEVSLNISTCSGGTVEILNGRGRG